MIRISPFVIMLAIAAFFHSGLGNARQAWPADPAAKRLEHWVAAYNTGDRAQIEASSAATMYRGKNHNVAIDNLVEHFVGIRAKTGPVNVSSVQTTDSTITVNAVSAATGNEVQIIAAVSDADDSTFKSISIRRAERKMVGQN